jgi:hypothetical protein
VAGNGVDDDLREGDGALGDCRLRGAEDASVPECLIEGESDPPHGPGHGFGRIACGREFRHQTTDLFVGETCRGDVSDPRSDSVVAEPVGFDRTGTEMPPVGDDPERVLSPGDGASVGVDPLAPVELRQLRSEPSFAVDLAVEALGVLSPVRPSISCPPRHPTVGAIPDRPSHSALTDQQEPSIRWRGILTSVRPAPM